MPPPMSGVLPFKISVLVFIRDTEGRLLLMRRRKSPNKGLWSCIGGKLDMGRGESPFEAAAREVREETGWSLACEDLRLFGMISEKNYEGEIHWLMFLFDCRKTLDYHPPDIAEGRFAFHAPEAVAGLSVPETDRHALWPLYFKNREGFTVLRADCGPGRPLKVITEQSLAPRACAPAGDEG